MVLGFPTAPRGSGLASALPHQLWAGPAQSPPRGRLPTMPLARRQVRSSHIPPQGPGAGEKAVGMGKVIVPGRRRSHSRSSRDSSLCPTSPRTLSSGGWELPRAG